MPTNHPSHLAAFSHIGTMSSDLPFPVFWVDLDGIVLGKNELAMKYYDFSSDAFLVGKTLFDLYPEKMADSIVQHNMEVMQTGEIYSQQTTLVDREGRKWEFDAMKIPVKTTDGLVVGLIVVPNVEEHVDLDLLSKLKVGPR